MFFKAVASFVKKFFFLINILFAIYSLLVFQLVFSANIQHWLGGFLMLSFPVVILVNLFFVVVWILSGSSRFLLSFLIMALTLPIFNRTYQWTKNTGDPYDFSVLSYNMMYADYSNFTQNNKNKATLGIGNSVQNLKADIKCFQEFYNDDKVYELALLKRITPDNPYYVYMHSERGNDRGRGAIGLATFSKYPIIKKEEVYWNTNNNGLLATDIVVEKDTIRVINFQLRSMGIRVNKMLDKDRKINKEETKNIFSQLKNGFTVRGYEVAVLESWIEESPYPVIIVGDLNELPYGYAYGKLSRLLKNGFEEKGNGFGFTYRKILRFLRIDNQFYDSKAFDITFFKTLTDHQFSDHYPIYGEYKIRD